MKYELVMQCKNDAGEIVNDAVIKSGEIIEPESIMDLGLRHSEQIEVLQKVQDYILGKQSKHLKSNINVCPTCAKPLCNNGVNQCSFNAVFTDHKVGVQRQICTNCKSSIIPSINSLFGTQMHPDLIKMQCEEASTQTYGKAKETLNRKSGKQRSINNKMTLHKVVETVGNHIAANPNEDTAGIKPAKELVVQADGGHLKAREPGVRSFEALTSVVYRPENITVHGVKAERGEVESKHCAAASILDDQKQISRLTLVAAKKEGLTKETKITALCDGASNCWNIISSLKNSCALIIMILDWFHIGVKFSHIGVFKSVDLNDLLESANWSLWHGNVSLFNERIDQLIAKVKDKKKLKKIRVLREYINNNIEKIVNYSERHDNGLVFTSSLAESTVESLINERCKGKQHMQWTREGVQPILQIRAVRASNDWEFNWENYILGAYQKSA